MDPADRRRALQILADSPNGCTDDELLTHGFTLSFLALLVVDGLATVEAWPIRAGARAMDVMRLRITQTGLRAAADAWPGDGASDNSRIKENIRYCRDRLRTESDGARRSLLNKILIDAEDRLGASLELIADIEREITTAKLLIDEHRALVATLERDGADRLAQARAMLDGLMLTQAVHEDYLRNLVKAP